MAISMLSATPPRGQAGTLWYMAPERLLGKPDYDELVDAWSLGCVMAELLAGEPLFRGHSATDQLLRIFRVLGGTCMASTPLAAAGQKLLTRRGGSRLRELFPEERLSRDGSEVLEGLLTWDPGEGRSNAHGLLAPPTSRLQPHRMRARPPFYLITWECISGYFAV
ncbi:putative cyclin-dependent kinase F-2 [Triticum aestivum]|uniref:putative cyclin-dependent kinase F-2 n=1 Tax=Triticum aestivum TaxID=4565 RepID=UPI001D008336|nr:putative cyclin-dependent kinase F-2 [Triticum aestivum]